jgi:hypothetical protein
MVERNPSGPGAREIPQGSGLPGPGEFGEAGLPAVTGLRRKIEPRPDPGEQRFVQKDFQVRATARLDDDAFVEDGEVAGGIQVVGAPAGPGDGRTVRMKSRKSVTESSESG